MNIDLMTTNPSSRRFISMAFNRLESPSWSVHLLNIQSSWNSKDVTSNCTMRSFNCLFSKRAEPCSFENSLWRYLVGEIIWDFWKEIFCHQAGCIHIWSHLWFRKWGGSRTSSLKSLLCNQKPNLATWVSRLCWPPPVHRESLKPFSPTTAQYIRLWWWFWVHSYGIWVMWLFFK